MRQIQVLLYLCSLQAATGFVPQSRQSVLQSLKSSSSSTSEQEEAVLVKFPDEAEGTTTTTPNGDPKINNNNNNNNNLNSIFMDDVTIDYSSGYSLNGYSSSGVYHNDLPGRFRRNLQAQEENEDGYRDMFGERKRSFLGKVATLPLRAARRLYYGPKKVEPGTLILVRHGESEWNQNKTFTGWSDPDLSVDGVREVEHAARLLLEGGWEIDMVFTSRLKRAIRSAWIILQEMNQVYLPVFKSWRLNERYATPMGLVHETFENLDFNVSNALFSECTGR
jgi:Histidine phosphatase superfamily (branch 1)